MSADNGRGKYPRSDSQFLLPGLKEWLVASCVSVVGLPLVGGSVWRRWSAIVFTAAGCALAFAAGLLVFWSFGVSNSN